MVLVLAGLSSKRTIAYIKYDILNLFILLYITLLLLDCLFQVLHRHPREASSKSAHHAEPGSTLSQSGTVIICNGGDNIADRIEGVTYAHSSWLLNCIAHYKLLHTD